MDHPAMDHPAVGNAAAGGSCAPSLLLPTSAGTFPKKTGGSRHFLIGTAQSAVLGDPTSIQLVFEFDPVAQCTVQDVRRPQRELFQIYPLPKTG